ncbi:hypothetical protein [Idiomarina abyssalis]|uniref:hypothetical protein n=1 Tax=Idiomarina abyssalis TaxID=86102 RepID=UPI003A937893
MTTRIPSSLKWLVSKRARLNGKREKLKTQIQDLSLDLKLIEAKLKSVDDVIRLHEIPLDPKDVPDIHPKTKNRFKYGSLTKAIYTVMHSADKALTTDDVATRAYPLLGIHFKDVDDYMQFRTSIRYRLKDLVRKGILESIKAPEDEYQINQPNNRLWQLKGYFSQR